MQTNPNCLKRVDESLFRARLSAKRQCRNTKALTAIMRGVLADGRVTEGEVPLLMEAHMIATAENRENFKLDDYLRTGQDNLVSVGDWADRLATK